MAMNGTKVDPNQPPHQVNGAHELAATYRAGTVEYDILNHQLPEPPTRVVRGKAHEAPPIPAKERFRGGARAVIKNLQFGNNFRYSRLQKGEIRLLCLHKGPDDQILNGSLFARKLVDVKERYEALSYTWGTERPKEHILIKDLNATVPSAKSGAKSNLDPLFDLNSRPKGNKSDAIVAITKGFMNNRKHLPSASSTSVELGVRFPIKRNLWQALRRLRKPDGPVYLWVDALCIDQSEAGKDEKEGQLAMMSDIYNSAANVCIWLGDGFAGAADGIQMVKDIMNFKMFDQVLDKEESKTKWPYLVGMMKAPWFTRRWIIQEIAFSRNAIIFCNDYSVHWDDFADAVSLLIEKIDHIRAGSKDHVFDDIETSSATTLVHTMTNICRKSQLGEIRGRLLDLETLVSTFLRFEASFARDTIYSILSLAKDRPQPDESWELLHKNQLHRNEENQRSARSRRNSMTEVMREHEQKMADKKKDKGIQLVPNYDMSTRDLFIAFVTRCIHRSGSLDIVCRHWAPEVLDTTFGDPVKMPTWVSSITESPYGGAGRSAGRQNGENFVSYTPDDQRQRYSASGERKATIAMIIDPALDPTSRQAKRSPMLDAQKSIMLQDPPRGRMRPPGYDSAQPRPSSSPQFHVPRRRDGPGHSHLATMRIIQEEESPTTAGALKNLPFSSRKDSAVDATSLGATDVKDFELGENGWLPGGQISDKELINSHKAETVLSTTESAETNQLGQASTRVSQALKIQVEDHAVQEGSSPLISSAVELFLAPDSTPDFAPAIKIPNFIDNPPQRGTNESAPVSAGTGRLAERPDVERHHVLSGILSVKGLVVGKIGEMSDVMRGGIVPGDWIARMGWDIMKSDNRAPEVLWRLLTADRTDKGGKPPQWYKRACLHGLVDPRVTDTEGNLHSKMQTGRTISEHTTRFFDRVANVVWNRRLIELRTWEELGGPRFGLAPNKAKVDDLVCILFGCSVPVVLRSLSDARLEGACEVIGECYVDGLMDGDAVTDDKFVDDQTSEFWLI